MFVFVLKQHDIKFIIFYITFKYKKHFNSINNVIPLLTYFDFFFSNLNFDIISHKINNQILDL